MQTKKIFKCELGGFVFTIAMIFILHFIYEFTAYSALGAVFGAVNESVWEHLKIIGFGYIFWLPFGTVICRDILKKYITVKAFLLVFLLCCVTFFFYIYSGIIGKTILWVDILSTVFFCALTAYFAFKLLTSHIHITNWFYAGVFVLLLLITLFLCFTPNPPHIALFEDYRGFYGINAA